MVDCQTNILLFLNQLVDCQVFFNSATVFAMADKELSSLKLYIDELETKKNKSFIKKLNRIGPVMEPWGTPEIIFWRLPFYHLYEHIDLGLWDTNKCRTTLFHLHHKLQVYQLIARGEYRTQSKALGKSVKIAPVIAESLSRYSLHFSIN